MLVGVGVFRFVAVIAYGWLAAVSGFCPRSCGLGFFIPVYL